MILRLTRWLGVILVAVGLAVGCDTANAGSIVFNGTGSDTDGALSARATFSLETDGTGSSAQTFLLITLENLQGGLSVAAGQEISQFFFTSASSLGALSFTSISGNEISLSGITRSNGIYAVPTNPTLTAQTNALPDSTNTALNWQFSNAASDVELNALSGGKPDHLILGPATGVNSSVVTHDPDFYKSATFKLYSSSLNSNTVLTTTDFTKVSFNFGTSGGEGTATGVPQINNFKGPAVPEPASIAVWGLLGLVGACYGRRRQAV